MALQPIQQRPAAAPKVNYAASLAKADPVSVFPPKSSSAASVAYSSTSSSSSSSSCSSATYA